VNKLPDLLTICEENVLGDDGIQILAESLFHNSVIRKLNLNRNFRFQTQVQRVKMIQHLSEMIGSSILKLETLSIAGASKGTNKDSRLKESLASLLPCLCKNKYLTELDISGHTAGLQGAIALAQVLEVNNTLTKLHWDDNNTNIIGLQTVTKSLQLNNSIREMSIPISDICKLIGPLYGSPIVTTASTVAKDDRKDIIRIVESMQKLLKRNQEY